MRGLPAYGVQRRANSLGVLRQRDVTTLSLLTGLVAYWKLDETSGTRIDSAGPNNLADNGSVGSATGKVGNAASFVAANEEYLSHTDTTALRAGSALTIACWFNADVLSGTLCSKWESVDSQDYVIDLRGGGGTPIRFYVYSSNSLVDVLSSSATITTGTWYFIVAWFDGAAQTINIQVNNGAVESLNVGLSSLVDVGSNFYVGSRGASATTSSPNFYDGLIDEIGLWHRALTTAEILILYNGGAGITFPF